MKYLSFSLWGDNPIYNIGAIKNAELWKSIYAEWQMIVYYNNTTPSNIINKLNELGVKTIDMSFSELFGAFWRFTALDIDDCEYVIFRDTDSRISIREKMAVDEWINSGTSLHVMRDHPYHQIPAGNNQLGILAGMWGMKGNILNITNMITSYPDSVKPIYGNDQTFLKEIFSRFEFDKCTHDEFFEKKPFPIEREYGKFVGGRIDENDNPIGEDYKLV